jgi:hypothetical protein
METQTSEFQAYQAMVSWAPPRYVGTVFAIFKLQIANPAILYTAAGTTNEADLRLDNIHLSV